MNFPVYGTSPATYSIDTDFTADFNSTVGKVFTNSTGYYMCGLYTTVNNNNGVKGNGIFGFCALDHTTGHIDTTFLTNEGASTLPVGMVKTATGYTIIDTSSSALYQNNTIGYMYDIDNNGDFNENTPLLTTTPGGYGSGERLGILSDGSILLFSNGNAVYNGVTYKRLIKLNTDKTVDATFNTNIGVGTGAGSTGVLVMPNDTIFVYGSFTSYKGVTTNRIIKLNADGTTDTSFVVGTGFNNNVFRIETDGTYIYCVGSFTTWKGGTANRIVKLDMAGDIASGWTTTGASSGQIQQISFLGTDCYICGTFTSYNGASINRLAKIDMTTGAEDGSFDVSGGGLSSSDQAYNRLYAISDGVILVPGITTVATWNGSNILGGICKISDTGVLDDKFGDGFGSNQILGSFRDGDRLFCFINNSYNGIRYYNLRALAYTTTIDQEGKNPTSLSWNDTFTATSLSTNLVDTGTDLIQYTGTLIIKTDYTGSKDTTYIAPVLSVATVRTLLYDNGLTLVGGDFSTVGGVTKRGLVGLDDDGAVDTSFVITNGITAPTFGFSIKDVIKTTGGKYLCVGTFTAFQTHNTVNAVLLNTDGTTDTSFTSGITESGSSTGGYSVVEDGGAYFVAVRSASSAGKIYKLSATGTSLGFSTPTFNQIIQKIVIVGDNIYVGGNFTQVNGTTCNYFVVVDKNTGAVVYNPGTDFNGAVLDMVAQGNTLMITGQFTTYKGITKNRAVRIFI